MIWQDSHLRLMDALTFIGLTLILFIMRYFRRANRSHSLLFPGLAVESSECRDAFLGAIRESI